jgi:hypothetical protein
MKFELEKNFRSTSAMDSSGDHKNKVTIKNKSSYSSVRD